MVAGGRGGVQRNEGARKLGKKSVSISQSSRILACSFKPENTKMKAEEDLVDGGWGGEMCH